MFAHPLCHLLAVCYRFLPLGHPAQCPERIEICHWANRLALRMASPRALLAFISRITLAHPKQLHWQILRVLLSSSPKKDLDKSGALALVSCCSEHCSVHLLP